MTRQIEKARLKVESRNLTSAATARIRRRCATDQRKAIYEQRNHLLEHASVSEYGVRDDRWLGRNTVNMHVAPESTEEQWDVAGLEAALRDVPRASQHPPSGRKLRLISTTPTSAKRCKTAALGRLRQQAHGGG